MIRLGSKKSAGVSDDSARVRATLSEALGSSEPEAFPRAVVREAWRLLPGVRGLVWFACTPAGITVGAQAPGQVVHADKLANSVVNRAANTKRPVRAELKIDPALVENPASVMVVGMRSRGQTAGLLLAVRPYDEAFDLAEEQAVDALLRAASDVIAQPGQAGGQAGAMPPVALLRIDLFWPTPPSDSVREQAVNQAGRIVRGHIRPTDDLRRLDTTALEASLKRPTPETVAIVSQRLHQALNSHVLELHGARWSIIPIQE